MLKIEPRELSFFSSAMYKRIPDNHMLKILDATLDFSFVNERFMEHYSQDFGRPAKEPVLLVKLLFLKHLYNLSDVQVIEQASLNVAWMWFLGLNLEDELPHPSLLTKFRTLRINDRELDDIIVELNRQCVEKGLVKSTGVCIDATHIEANTIKKIPERMMKQLSGRILGALKEDLTDIPAEIDTAIPDYTQITDHVEAKQVMLQYLEHLIEQAEPFAGENTTLAIAEAKEILADELFILQKGVRSLVDKDARVGRKSKTESFFGYKAEFAMLAEDRLITGVTVQSGEKVDGVHFAKLIEETLKAGISPKKIYGDKAYCRPDILAKAKEIGAEPIIPVSESAYRINEKLFSYNKDSDQWFCFMGNHTVKKSLSKQQKNGKEYQQFIFTFDKELCLKCPHRAECMGKSKSKARQLRVSMNTSKLWELSQKQKTDQFKSDYKKRSAIEWKNAELKRFHGLARAAGYGLKAVSTQAKLTVLAVNLKRIAALAMEKSVAPLTSAAAFQLNYLFRKLFPSADLGVVV